MFSGEVWLLVGCVWSVISVWVDCSVVMVSFLHVHCCVLLVVIVGSETTGLPLLSFDACDVCRFVHVEQMKNGDRTTCWKVGVT